MGGTQSSSSSPPAPAAPAAPKVTVNSIMEGIPTATDKDFPSAKALAVITLDPEAVSEGKDVYKTKSVEGSLKLYKQKMTKMDKSTLRKAVQAIQRDWDVDVQEMDSFKMFVASTTEEGWNYDSNVVEELEHNSSGTQFLFFQVVRDEGKFSLAICNLKSDTPLYNEVLIAGLMIEGLLGKDEKQRLYLQF